jgi:hypothetical protein
MGSCLRPLFWIVGDFAIQGQAGMNYIDNDRGYTNGKFFGTNSPKMKTINAKLPQPIADYFEAANAHKTDAVVAAFAEDALVTDENRRVTSESI